MEPVTKFVLNDGYIKLIDYMGGDKAVIRAARFCFQSQGNEKADENLIKTLIREDHKSPLEHALFTFEVKAPIMVVRHWLRHRMASPNEKSLRYCEADPSFWIPDALNEDEKLKWASDCSDQMEDYYHYINLLKKRGFSPARAREIARGLLPLALYSEFIWTVNGSSLWNFIEQRTSKHAQLETRKYGYAALELAKIPTPLTFGAIEASLGLKK